MAYPYSKAETIADAVVHALGLLLAVPGIVLLLWQGTHQGANAWSAVALYGLCLILAFVASAVYHMCPIDRLRPLLCRIDHAAIYLKIAGTYTPFAVLLASPLSYGVLTTIWALAIGGAAAKLSYWRPDARGSLALYLGMGWLATLLIWPMSQQFPSAVVWLVVAGGLIYSAGTRVYAHPGMKYQNAIWHSFVLSASICLFSAVSLSL